jgi:hypothetical protein
MDTLKLLGGSLLLMLVLVTSVFGQGLGIPLNHFPPPPVSTM